MSSEVINKSSVNLLKECDAGVKMAVKNIDDILDHVSDDRLKDLLEHSRKRHIELKIEIEEMLKNYGEDEKEPNMMAKGMAFVKTNVKTSMNETDSACADLLTDGCNMGIKSLIKYLNKHQDAEEDIKLVCGKLINTEEELLMAIRPFL